MRRSTLWMCALLVTTTFGCEQVKKQAATVGATVKDQIERVRERFFHKKPPLGQAAAPAVATPAPPPAPAPAPAHPVPAHAAPVHAAVTEPAPPIPSAVSHPYP